MKDVYLKQTLLFDKKTGKILECPLQSTPDETVACNCRCAFFDVDELGDVYCSGIDIGKMSKEDLTNWKNES